MRETNHKTRRHPPKREQTRWLEYEQRKRDWIADHPNATPEQYSAAIIKIAKDCGV